jgi:hypothetical protein
MNDCRVCDRKIDMQFGISGSSKTAKSITLSACRALAPQRRDVGQVTCLPVAATNRLTISYKETLNHEYEHRAGRS